MQLATTNNYRGGGRIASAAYRHSRELSLNFSGIDRTTDRYQLLLLVKRVGKQAGFTPRMIQLLDYYMAFTTQADWEEGSRPIVFQSLARTAMDLGVGERQIQKLEKQLFKLGAITWNDSGNHKRFGRRDPKSGRLVFAYGVDLSPLAHLKEELEAKLHEKQLYAEAWRTTKREISEYRRQIRSLLVEFQEEGADLNQLQRFELAYREIAIELRSHIDLSRMRSLLNQHMSLRNAIFDEKQNAASTKGATPNAHPPIAPATQKRSRSRAEKFAHQEHSTLLDKNKPTDASCENAEGNHRGLHCNKAVGRKQAADVGQYAVDRLQQYLPLTSSGVTSSDLVEAGNSLRRDLGISQVNWTDACGLLGRQGALLGVLLTDQAVQRSGSQVKRPPAYFRAIVRRMAAERRRPV